MESEFNVYYVGEHRPTPGPGAYKIPSSIGSGPRSTISPRYKSVQPRSDPSLVSVPSSIGNCPKISMGSRLHEPRQQATPGPGYVPPSFGSNAPRITFPKAKQSRKKKSKKKSKSDDKSTPGPGAYSPKTDGFGSDAKMGSIPHSARSTVFTKKPSDMPVYAPNYEPDMKSSPRYSIAHRTAVKNNH